MKPMEIKMADKKPETVPPRARLEATTEFVMALRQTPSRDTTQIFTGKGREAAAEAYINEVLGNGGTAFILTPTRAFTAPERPVATEIKLGDDNG
jgi:hypothetical protein